MSAVEQGSNSFIGDLQIFKGWKKEINGEAFIIRNNGQNGSLSGKTGFETAVPIRDIAILEELCRRVRIQNGTPSYEEILVEMTQASEFTGRVAEVWREIEASPDLVNAIIAIRDSSGDQGSLLTLNESDVETLCSRLCVIEEKESVSNSKIESGDLSASTNPADYRISSGVGAAILAKIRIMESNQAKNDESDSDNDQG